MVLPLPAVDSVTTQLADCTRSDTTSYVRSYLPLPYFLAQTYSLFTFHEDLQIYGAIQVRYAYGHAYWIIKNLWSDGPFTIAHSYTIEEKVATRMHLGNIPVNQSTAQAQYALLVTWIQLIAVSSTHTQTSYDVVLVSLDSLQESDNLRHVSLQPPTHAHAIIYRYATTTNVAQLVYYSLPGPQSSNGTQHVIALVIAVCILYS